MKSQKIKKRGMRRLIFLLPLLLLSMSSCIKDPTMYEPETLPDVPKGMVRIGLYTSSGDYQTPVTRAATDEGLDADSDPWVFVFRGNDDNAIFAEVKQAVRSGMTMNVVLTRKSSAVRVLVVANAPARFFNGTGEADFTETVLTTALTGKTFAEAVNDILNTEKLTALPTPSTIPYITPQPQYLPMTGVINLTKINAETSIGTIGDEVELTRVVAKVTVINSASGFTLNSASVIGAKQFGRLYQTTPITAMANNENIDFTADIVTAIGTAGVGNTNDSPLYIYESIAGETSVIVKGAYGGNDYYYRLAFKSKADGKIMAVERNKWYNFEITNVEGPGYDSFDEAAAAFAPSSNITAEVDVVDLSSHDIIDNGQYYLGVSNSEFIVYADGELNDLVALTVSTNASVDIPMILSASTKPTKLTVGTGTESTSNGIRISNITVSLADAFATDESVSFTITLGNLQKTIKVTRRAQLTPAASVTEFAGGYTAGKIGSQGSGGAGWLSLSLNGVAALGDEVTRPNGGGKLYLMTKNNISRSDVADRTGGEVFFYRHNKNGGVKLYVEQKGYKCYPAYPGVLGYNPATDKLTRDGTGVMVYFKYGSVIALFAGVSGDTWSSDDVAFNPSGITVTEYSDILTYNSNLTVQDAAKIAEGFGDPCRLVGLTRAQIANGSTIDNMMWRTPKGGPYENLGGVGTIYPKDDGRTPTYNTSINEYRYVLDATYGAIAELDLINTAVTTYGVECLRLPFAGYRGTDGKTTMQGKSSTNYYGSATQHGTTAQHYIGIFNKFLVLPGNNEGLGKHMALPRRCIPAD